MFSTASSPVSRFASSMFSNVPSPTGYPFAKLELQPVSPVFIGNSSPQDDTPVSTTPVKIPLTIDVSLNSHADPSLILNGERNPFSVSIATAADKQYAYRYVRDGKWIGPMSTDNLVYNLADALVTHVEHIDRDLLATKAIYKESFNILQDFANSTLVHLNTLFNDVRKMRIESAETVESNATRFADMETYAKNTDDDVADLTDRVRSAYDIIDNDIVPRLLELEERCNNDRMRVADTMSERKASDFESAAMIDKLVVANRALSNQVDALTTKVAKLSTLADTSNCLIVSMQYFILYLIGIFLAFCAFEYYSVHRV